VDPFYLAWVARRHGMYSRLIEVAGEINTEMPSYVVERVADALNDRGKPLKGSNVLLLGMAYKRDVDDVRESPGLRLLELLLHKGAAVQYNDPHIPELPAPAQAEGHGIPHLTSRPLTPDLLRAQDCVLVVTDHSAYDWDWVVEHARLVVDTRNATAGVRRGRERIVRA
jgi:UDP-N-acetyl-D-glucosamine dehydrogenase